MAVGQKCVCVGRRFRDVTELVLGGPGGGDVPLQLYVPNPIRIPFAMPEATLTMAVGQCGVEGVAWTLGVAQG